MTISIDHAKELLEIAERMIEQHEKTIIELRSQNNALLEAAKGILPVVGRGKKTMTALEKEGVKADA